MSIRDMIALVEQSLSRVALPPASMAFRTTSSRSNSTAASLSPPAARAQAEVIRADVTPRAQPRVLRGVVFDMDGTLTVPCIDFVEMRRRVGATTGDILHEIDQWEDDRRAEAYRVIGEIEADAKQRLQIMPGARELCSFLDSRFVRRGLITRNVRGSVDHFHSHMNEQLKLPPFSPALSREFRPYKPSAAPLLHICEQWRIEARHVIMLGDSAKDDVVCGKQSGAITILLDQSNRFPDVHAMPEEIRPHFRVETLYEVLQLLASPAFALHPTDGALADC